VAVSKQFNGILRALDKKKKGDGTSSGHQASRGGAAMMDVVTQPPRHERQKVSKRGERGRHHNYCGKYVICTRYGHYLLSAFIGLLLQ